MVNPFFEPVTLSLCPGFCGLERGLKNAIGKIHIAAYVEIEAFIIANLLAGMEEGVLDTAPVWTDVKTFPAHLFRGKVNGIIGGYPCQPFSIAGNGAGVNDPRHLWPFIARHILAIQPDWCFFENVANHLNIGYCEVKRELEEMGYRVKEGIYSAEEVGATHQRKRLFILAIRLANSESVRTLPGEQKYAENETSGKQLARTKSRCDSLDSGATLDNPVSGRHGGSNKEICTGRNSAKYADKTMANSHSLGNDGTGELRDNADGPQDLQQRGIPLAEPADDGKAMAYDNGTGRGELSRTIAIREEQLSAEYGSRSSRWPAGQGIYQHSWEEPRTVEPGMGCSANGYNFRNDILRAYGNSVVEQTAELAFTDLIMQHIAEIELLKDLL